MLKLPWSPRLNDGVALQIRGHRPAVVWCIMAAMCFQALYSFIRLSCFCSFCNYCWPFRGWIDSLSGASSSAAPAASVISSPASVTHTLPSQRFRLCFRHKLTTNVVPFGHNSGLRNKGAEQERWQERVKEHSERLSLVQKFGYDQSRPLCISTNDTRWWRVILWSTSFDNVKHHTSLCGYICSASDHVSQVWKNTCGDWLWQKTNKYSYKSLCTFKKDLPQVFLDVTSVVAF